MARPEDSSNITEIDDLEFEERVLSVIRNELGLGGLARFLMTFRSGQGDYTEERHHWLDGITPEELERELMLWTES